ncbi:MAG: transporter [Sulfurovum sp.]|nr:transporter [Sulfurovum sp.]
MIRNIFILIFVTGVIGFAADFKDKDFDGVPDSLDQCPNTPFLTQVNAKGCTTETLMLVSDTVTDSLVLSLKFGFITNEDLLGKDTERTNKIRITYYHDDWSYILRTGYLTHSDSTGMLDTTFKIRKRFKPTPNLRVKVSASLRLPTRDFAGNNTDISLSSSFNYYLSKKASLFAGVQHTFVRDEQISIPLQNKSSFYLGAGYFLTKKLYTDISYAYAQSKFTTKYAVKSLRGALSYDINNQWFTTVSYEQDIDDEDTHNTLNFTIGYRFW